MKARSLRLLALCSTSLLGACADEGVGGPEGPAVEIAVAPLTLANVTGVEYALAVFNGSPGSSPYTGVFNNLGVVQAPYLGSLVWQQSSLTSIQYGNGAGGDLSYVGPCDAQGTGNQLQNYVALALKQVAVSSGGSLTGAGPSTPGNEFIGANKILDDQNTGIGNDPDFINPCPYNDACVLDFPCKENKDTQVVFNLTIMRDADQGFFDIAVNFEDVFCSAKFETCYGVTVTDNPASSTTSDLTYFAYEDTARAKYWAKHNATIPEANNVPGWEVFNRTSDTAVSPYGGVGARIGYTTSYVGTTPSTKLGQIVSLIGVAIGELSVVTEPVQSTTNATPISLLFGSSGDREHTAIAALACTVGPDTADTGNGNIATKLVLTQPVVSCEGGSVTFTLPLTGAAQGNQPALNEDGTTNHCTASSVSVPCKLSWALYFGNEGLQCLGHSCNKVYYNIAFNIANLASQGLKNCELGYAATAIESTDTTTFWGSTASPASSVGTLKASGGQYGAIRFGGNLPGNGLPLTSSSQGNAVTSCNSHPLGASGSLVKASYVKGSGFSPTQVPVFKFFSIGGSADNFPNYP